MQPTYDELKAQNDELRALVKQLLERIADLESQLNKNSKNSSKPPSSDQKSNLPRINKKDTRPYHPGALRKLLPETMITSQTDRRIEVCPRCRSAMKSISTNIHHLSWGRIAFGRKEYPTGFPETHPFNC